MGARSQQGARWTLVPLGVVGALSLSLRYSWLKFRENGKHGPEGLCSAPYLSFFCLFPASFSSPSSSFFQCLLRKNNSRLFRSLALVDSSLKTRWPIFSAHI